MANLLTMNNATNTNADAPTPKPTLYLIRFAADSGYGATTEVYTTLAQAKKAAAHFPGNVAIWSYGRNEEII